MTVPGSNWSNSQILYVGYFGTGTLTIDGGGTVSSLYGYVGAVPGAEGAMMRIALCSKVDAVIMLSSGRFAMIDGGPGFQLAILAAGCGRLTGLGYRRSASTARKSN